MLFEKIKLEDDEQVLLVVRRHWFILFTRIFSVILVALAPFVLFFIATSQPQVNDLILPGLGNYGDPLLFVSGLWLLINWTTLAHIWTDHYLDLWMVTDRRIISIDQKALFIRSVGSFRLERLQDMNIEINGFMATMLNYGTVEAQTASGSEEEFRVKGLPNPREIKALILEAADNRMEKRDQSM